MNKDKNIRTLGKQSAMLLATLSEAGKILFTPQDAQRILKTSRNNVLVLLSDLTRRKWLVRLARGKYLIVPLETGLENTFTLNPFVITSHLVKPYYISYWSALNHYGYTEQVPGKVLIATTSRKNSVAIQNVDYQFITLTKKKFFGFAKIWIENKQVNMATKEKLILDCLDHPEYCGGVKEAAKGLWNARNELKWNTLLKYAEKMQTGTVYKRLGCLMELYEMRKDLLKKLQGKISAGFSPLDPILPKKGKLYSKWNLQLNVDENELTEWMEH